MSGLNLEVIQSWPIKKLKDALWVLYFDHVLDELCIVDILHKVHENGKQVTRQELLADLTRIIEAERTFIVLMGRREAGKVYGAHEGVTSAMKTVDFILTHDIVGDYQKRGGE